jgi:hypothetical protein
VNLRIDDHSARPRIYRLGLCRVRSVGREDEARAHDAPSEVTPRQLSATI